MSNVLIATTVAATGEADAPYNLATFTLVLMREEATQVEAKEKLVVASEEFHAVLNNLENNLEVKVVKGSLTANPSVNLNQVWEDNVRVIKGYNAFYHITFQVSSLDKVSLVYDKLSSLKGVQMNSPHFSLKNSDKLNGKALAKAWVKVSERFAEECKVLGLSPEDFQVASWETSYSDSHRTGRRLSAAKSARGALLQSSALGGMEIESSAPGAAFSAGATTTAPAVLEIVVGRASVEVNLNVSYVRKTGH